ncbi:MAG: YqgE/AlgH family protein [Thermoanaerobaculia bacterium]
MAASDLVPPMLLLAMPQVLDPFFRKSVVLLVAHAREGSLGFIVNRATDLKLAETLTEMQLEWPGDDDPPVLFGGPVQPQVGTVLFGDGERGAAPEVGNEICPGVRISQHFQELSRLVAAPPANFRLLLGHAGWGAGQLVDEILRNDWLTAPPSGELVFGELSEATWEAGLRSVGVDPSTLPAWTPVEDDGEAN